MPCSTTNVFTSNKPNIKASHLWTFVCRIPHPYNAVQALMKNRHYVHFQDRDGSLGNYQSDFLLSLVYVTIHITGSCQTSIGKKSTVFLKTWKCPSGLVWSTRNGMSCLVLSRLALWFIQTQTRRDEARGRKAGHEWWRHQMETFSALPALCAGNSPVAGEFPTQRPVMRSFDVFLNLRLE